MLPAPDPQSTMQLTIPADPTAVRNGLICLVAAPLLSDLDPDHRRTAELVLAEVLNNVAEHAYAGRPGDVSVTLRRDPRGLHCLIVDSGLPMPGGTAPLGQLPGGPDAALDDLPEGGFGWHLIHSLTQGLHYARQDGQNRLSFLVPPG